MLAYASAKWSLRISQGVESWLSVSLGMVGNACYMKDLRLRVKQNMF